MPELQPSASTLRNLQPTEKLQKKPSWSSDWVKNTILEQDPNADDYDKYSLPLGREDTNEEIIEEGTENTESIESTRLRYWKYGTRLNIKLDMQQEAVARID